MPVVIDQLDLVDTQPDPPRDAGAPAPRPAVPVEQTVASLRAAAQRAARVRAD